MVDDKTKKAGKVEETSKDANKDPNKDANKDVNKSVEEQYTDILALIQNEIQIFDAIKRNLYGTFLAGKANNCGKHDFTSLQKMLDVEKLKLQDLVRRAVRIQFENPDKGFQHITLPTSIEEDIM